MRSDQLETFDHFFKLSLNYSGGRCYFVPSALGFGSPPHRPAGLPFTVRDFGVIVGWSSKLFIGEPKFCPMHHNDPLRKRGFPRCFALVNAINPETTRFCLRRPTHVHRPDHYTALLKAWHMMLWCCFYITPFHIFILQTLMSASNNEYVIIDMIWKNLLKTKKKKTCRGKKGQVYIHQLQKARA